MYSYIDARSQGLVQIIVACLTVDKPSLITGLLTVALVTMDDFFSHIFNVLIHHLRNTGGGVSCLRLEVLLAGSQQLGQNFINIIRTLKIFDGSISRGQ